MAVCPKCGKSVHRTGLNIHLQTHEKGSYLWDICSREYPSKSSLQDHKKVAHYKIPCTECGKLVGVSSLKRHMLQSHPPDDQKPYRCDTCGKGFISSNYLANHINTHTGDKPHKCNYCPQSFASRGTHAMHERGLLGCGRNKTQIDLRLCSEGSL